MATRCSFLLGLVVSIYPICTPASATSIGLTRFGGCLTPPGGCTLTINDNDPLHDLDPTVGVIRFNAQIGQNPDGIFSASGTLFEVVSRDAAGRVIGLALTLTDAIVLGLSGGTIGTPPHMLGQIALVSNVPISAPGVTGSVFLFGQYAGTTGTIGFADIAIAGFVGGAFFARADPPPAIGAPTPVGFMQSASGSTCCPVNNLLIGTIDFGLAAGDAFLLPLSADFTAQAIPEPVTFLLLGAGLIGLGSLARVWRRIGPKEEVPSARSPEAQPQPLCWNGATGEGRDPRRFKT